MYVDEIVKEMVDAELDALPHRLAPDEPTQKTVNLLSNIERTYSDA